MKRIFALAASLILLTNIAFAQGSADSEILKIETKLGQINIAIEQTKPEPFEIRVTDNGIPAPTVKWDDPDRNRLQLVVLVTLNPDQKFKNQKDILFNELRKLEVSTKANVLSLNVVKDSNELYKKLKFPNWQTKYFDSLEEGVNASLASLHDSLSSPRKALLILTNNVKTLPMDVIKETNGKLGREAAMVYVMSINYNKAEKTAVIARTNINGNDYVIFPSDFLPGMFKSITRLANNYYNVSYEFPEDQETTISHHIEAVVRGKQSNTVIARNIRDLNFENVPAPAAAVPDPVSTAVKNIKFVQGTALSANADRAIKTLLAKGEVRNTFQQALTSRAADLSAEARDYYWQELVNRPESKGLDILPADSDQVKTLYRELGPIFRAFKRENYTRIFVYHGDKPFIGLYRECILIFSTKTLELLTDKEIIAAAAHELSHEFIIDEMRKADKTNDIDAYHLIEHTADLMAVIALEEIKESPKALISGIKKMYIWYQTYLPGIEIDHHPLWEQREACILEFLEIENAGMEA